MRTYELQKRLLFTILILAVYLIGRSVLLFHIDTTAYELEQSGSENLVMSMVSGGRYRYTIFALGLMPYFLGSMLVQVVFALLGADFRSKFSPQKFERVTLTVVLIVTVAYAVSWVGSLSFTESVLGLGCLRGIAILEMTAGALAIYWLVAQNKRYGIAAQTPLLLINILGNLAAMVQSCSPQELRQVAVVCLLMATVVLAMENTLIKMPVQRVSIHSEYADKSYIAFKLNPIGVMPVMFASVFFTLPRLALRLALYFVENPALERIHGRLTLTDPLGICVYMATIFTVTVVFSFVLLAPGHMAKQLQKGGDSIVGVYAGRKTKRYLKRKLLMLGSFSGTVLSVLMGVSLFLALEKGISPELALLPATTAILVSLICSLCQEAAAYWRFDSYRFFL